jgi:hypothetical protein
MHGGKIGLSDPGILWIRWISVGSSGFRLDPLDSGWILWIPIGSSGFRLDSMDPLDPLDSGWIRWIPDTNIPLIVCLFVCLQVTTLNQSQSKTNSLGVPLGPQLLYFRRIPRSSITIFWRHP